MSSTIQVRVNDELKTTAQVTDPYFPLSEDEILEKLEKARYSTKKDALELVVETRTTLD